MRDYISSCKDISCLTITQKDLPMKAMVMKQDSVLILLDLLAILVIAIFFAFLKKVNFLFPPHNSVLTGSRILILVSIQSWPLSGLCGVSLCG